MPDPTPPSALARALGRIPCGLYIVTTYAGQEPLGFLASFVMQSGFTPPTLSIAVSKERHQLKAMQQCGRFALSILDASNNGLMAPFFKKLPEGSSPFDGLATTLTAGGSRVLADALAWLDCRLHSVHELSDHVLVIGTVVEGALLREGEPKVHLRKNGLGY